MRWGSAFVSTMLMAGIASAGDPRAAEALFQRAQTLMKKPDATKEEIHQACEYFVESYKQDAAVNTLVASAACHEKEGRNATAWGEYKEVGAQPGSAAEYARQRAADLEKAGFMKLTVKTPSQKRLSFKIDDAQLSIAPDDFPMDPGSHDLEVSAPGKVSYKRHFDLTERTSPLTINVPELEDAKVETPVVNNPPPQQIVTRVVQVAEKDPGGPYRGWGLFSIIFGSLTIATSAVGGVLAQAIYQESIKDCTAQDVCIKSGFDRRNTANALANLATGVFIGGAVLVAFGITLYIVAPKKHMAEVRAAFGPAGAGLEGTF